MAPKYEFQEDCRCPICNKRFKSDACPHSIAEARDRVATNRLQAAIDKHIAKQMNSQKKCVACNGSGVYDNTGLPPCGSCNGVGYK